MFSTRPARRRILRARWTAALLLGLVAFAAGASDPAAVSGRAAPVVLSDVPPPAPLRRLTPRGEPPAAESERRSGPVSTGSLISALAVVVMLILGGAKVWRTHGPKVPNAAPREAVEVLGRCRIESRQSVYLLRFGSRVLVLGSSGGELSALSEVTDPVEVDLITAQCRAVGGGVSTFSRLFEARRKAESASDVDSGASPGAAEDSRPVRWPRTPAEERLAAKVRGRTPDGEASRVA